jgi:hypothetical protein
MFLKFEIGAHVAKRKASASLRLPNKRGVVVGFVEKPNKNGARRFFYVVKCEHSDRCEEWSPGVTFLVSDETASPVAFCS